MITANMVAAFLAWDLGNKNAEMGDFDVAIDASNDDDTTVDLTVNYRDLVTGRSGFKIFTFTVKEIHNG